MSEPPTSPVRRAASGAWTGVRGAGRGVGHAARGGSRRFREFLASEGAVETGLARLLELHVVQSAADAAVTVALAGTVFALPTGQARGQVALFLAITMAPFTLLAPLVGPLLDRYPHGRRWAIGGTLALRALFAWSAATAVVEGSTWLYPSALGILVASRAYAVSRAAAVPLVLPDRITLVAANSRISVAGMVGMALGGGGAFLLSRIGPDWALRGAFVGYAVATVLAILLTPRVDSPAPVPRSTVATERTVVLDQPNTEPTRSVRTRTWLAMRWRRYLLGFPDSVRALLVAAVGSRVLSGLLTVFVVFLARENPPSGWGTAALIGAAGGGASVGTALGTWVGHRVRGRGPDAVGLASVALAATVAVLAAMLPSGWTVTALATASGLTSQLVKICLDAVVQRDVAERTRSRIFGWTETWLQVGWVCGGALGLALPTLAPLGFGVAALALVSAVGAAAVVRRRMVTARPT